MSERLAIYCADVGSIRSGNFGWARADLPEGYVERHRGGPEIVELVDVIADDLSGGVPVALGFECPVFVPVPEEPVRLGMARAGEGNRSWSAGAGTGALATGLVQMAWILKQLRARAPDAEVFLDWGSFWSGRRGLFLWEAFVTDRAKAETHVDDAAVAVTCFVSSLPDPPAQNAIVETRVLSLLGAAMLWSGWSDELELLHTSCLVLRAPVPNAIEAAERSGLAARVLDDTTRRP